MGKINYKKLKYVIDEWDPIKMFPSAPSDEYDIKTNKIYRFISENTTVEELASIIQNVFSRFFNEPFDYERCMIVAQKIFVE
jgi:hypothetical protein